MMINTCDAASEYKAHAKKKLETFQFQVLFLMDNLGYEPQENQVNRMAEFRTHPRKIYSQERGRKQGTTIEHCLR